MCMYMWVDMRREIPYLQEALHYSAYCTMYNILMIHFFDDFLKISELFLKISKDSPKVVQRPDNCFRKFFEDCRRFPKITKYIRITHRNTSKNFLRDYATIARCSLQQYCSFPFSVALFQLLYLLPVRIFNYVIMFI